MLNSSIVQYEFSFNKNLINKPKSNKGIDYTSFKNTKGTINDLISIVKQGFAIAPCTYKGKRNKKNVVHSNLWIGDIDKGLSLNEALKNEFIKKYCLIYTSPSHTKENHRYRLISFLPVTVDNQTYEALGKIINKKIGGHLDKNAMEAGRLFYGCCYAEWFNPNPEEIEYSLISEAIKQAEKKEAEKKANQEKNTFDSNSITEEDKKQALEALKAIPPKTLGDGRYEEMRSVGVALVNLFGFYPAIQLMDNHSNCGDQYWESKLKTSKGNFSLGTIIHTAKQYGYSPIVHKTVKKNNSKDFAEWKEQEYKNYTSFNPNVTVDCEYLAKELNKIDINNKILAVKSDMKTGKSYWLKSLTDKQLLILGNRQILTQQLANKLKISYIDEFFKSDLAQSAIIGGESTSIVIDSLTKLENTDFTGLTVVIDEAVQVLESLMIAKTHIKNVRGRAWAILAKMVKECESLILLDANLSNCTVDYFKSLCNKPVEKILNKYSEAKENKRKAIFYSDKDDIYTKIEIALTRKQKIFVLSDSERELNALQKYLNQYRSVLITRPALGNNPENKRFIENNGLAIKQEEIQLVLANSVVQSGISLEIDNYFDEVFGIFHGVVDTSTARQMILRDRGFANRHIWTSQYGIGYANRFNWKELKKSNELSDEYLLESVQYFEKVEKLTRPEAIAKLSDLMKSQHELLELNQEYVAKLTAKNNINLSCFREIFLKELQDSGFECFRNGDVGYPVMEEINKIKKDLLENEAERISNSQIISEDYAKVLNTKPSLNDKEKAELMKHRILKFLPDFKITTPFILEYILKNKFKTLLGIQNYFLVHNTQIAKTLDFNAISHALSEAQKGGVFYISSKRYSLLTEIWQELKLSNLINSEISTGKALNLIKAIPNKIRCILRSLGIRWNQNSYPTKVLKTITQLFGFTLNLSRKNKERVYIIEPIELDASSPKWQSIFKAIKRKFSKDLVIEKELLEQITGEEIQIKSETKLKPTAQRINKNNIITACAGYFNPCTERKKGRPKLIDSQKALKDNLSLNKVQNKLLINKEKYDDDINNLIKTANSVENLANDLFLILKELPENPYQGKGFNVKRLSAMSDRFKIDFLSDWIESIMQFRKGNLGII